MKRIGQQYGFPGKSPWSNRWLAGWACVFAAYGRSKEKPGRNTAGFALKALSSDWKKRCHGRPQCQDSLDHAEKSRHARFWHVFEGLARLFSFDYLGALVTKTITAELREGNPTPRGRGRAVNAQFMDPQQGRGLFDPKPPSANLKFASPPVVSVSAPRPSCLPRSSTSTCPVSPPSKPIFHARISKKTARHLPCSQIDCGRCERAAASDSSAPVGEADTQYCRCRRSRCRRRRKRRRRPGRCQHNPGHVDRHGNLPAAPWQYHAEAIRDRRSTDRPSMVIRAQGRCAFRSLAAAASLRFTTPSNTCSPVRLPFKLERRLF